jgi:hypothetical protein
MKNLLTSFVIGGLAAAVWMAAILGTGITFQAPKHVVSLNQRTGNLISLSLIEGNGNATAKADNGQDNDQGDASPLFSKEVLMPETGVRENVYRSILLNGRQIANSVFAIH